MESAVSECPRKNAEHSHLWRVEAGVGLSTGINGVRAYHQRRITLIDTRAKIRRQKDVVDVSDEDDAKGPGGYRIVPSFNPEAFPPQEPNINAARPGGPPAPQYQGQPQPQYQQPPPQYQQPPPPPPPQAGSSDMIDQLNQLAALHQQGVLTDDEFAAAKAKLFSS